jgi:hypothetical protein
MNDTDINRRWARRLNRKLWLRRRLGPVARGLCLLVVAVTLAGFLDWLERQIPTRTPTPRRVRSASDG